MIPVESVAPTLQYFVADSSIARLSASTSIADPSTTWRTSMRVKAFGCSSICTPSARTSYRVTSWRFLRRIEITSIAVQPASAIGISSAGRGPASPLPSSRTNACPLPDVATKRRVVPSSVTDAVLTAMSWISVQGS